MAPHCERVVMESAMALNEPTMLSQGYHRKQQNLNMFLMDMMSPAAQINSFVDQGPAPGTCEPIERVPTLPPQLAGRQSITSQVSEAPTPDQKAPDLVEEL